MTNYDIFISYRREGGREIARTIKLALEARGLTTTRSAMVFLMRLSLRLSKTARIFFGPFRWRYGQVF